MKGRTKKRCITSDVWPPGPEGGHGNLECEPSQKGIVLECLQAHQATALASLISVFSGPRFVPLCEPSQNGWLFERPHAHHQYVPGSTFWTIGLFWKMIGSFIT